MIAKIPPFSCHTNRYMSPVVDKYPQLLLNLALQTKWHMKFMLCSTVFILSLSANAQVTTLIERNSLYGLETVMPDSSRLRIEPIYKKLNVFVSRPWAKFLEQSTEGWPDTEYIEVAIDEAGINTHIDTIVSMEKNVIADMGVVAKRGCKYGLIDYIGKVLIPFKYTSISSSLFVPKNTNNFDTAGNKVYYFDLYKGKWYAVADNKGKIVISHTYTPIESKKFDNPDKLECMSWLFVDGFLLISRGSNWVDTAGTEIYTSCILPAMEKDKFVKLIIDTNDQMWWPLCKDKCTFDTVKVSWRGLKGGEYNLIDTRTGKLYAEKWAKDIHFVFDDPGLPGTTYFQLSPTNLSSIRKYQTLRNRFRAGPTIRFVY